MLGAGRYARSHSVKRSRAPPMQRGFPPQALQRRPRPQSPSRGRRALALPRGSRGQALWRRPRPTRPASEDAEHQLRGEFRGEDDEHQLCTEVLEREPPGEDSEHGLCSENAEHLLCNGDLKRELGGKDPDHDAAAKMSHTSSETSILSTNSMVVVSSTRSAPRISRTSLWR